LLEHARQRLKKPGRDEAAIDRAVANALAAGGLKLDDKNLTQYLLFLGEGEILRFVALVEEHFDALAKEVEKTEETPGGGKKKTAKQQKAAAKEAVPDEVRKAVPDLLDGGKAADLGLFGRMLADLPEKNVDAACQVSHAVSTNKIHSMEMDYYTAVDDINNDNPGADMIGTVEFNSACFYRYANLDLGQLDKNLQGDADLVKTTVSAFLKAFIHAIPSGKQNSFAAHNPPSLVFAVVRDGAPVSLANAFVKPVATGRDGDLVALSINAMDDYYGRLVGMYGVGGLKKSALSQMGGVAMKNLKDDVGSIENLIETVIAAAFPAGRAA
jgi:CRISPR system Cascade subunit CasC